MNARSSLLTSLPRGSRTPAEAPLIDAEILLKQPQLLIDERSHGTTASITLAWLRCATRAFDPRQNNSVKAR
jgi:hypothetical protein